MRLRDEKGDKYYLLRQFELYLIILYGVVITRGDRRRWRKE